MTPDEIKESIEHRDALLDVRAILATSSGKNFVRYLFKNLEVAELPELGLEGSFLMDKLGFLRAGNAIFKLISEASPVIAGNILAEVEKERHANIYRNHEVPSPE